MLEKIGVILAAPYEGYAKFIEEHIENRIACYILEFLYNVTFGIGIELVCLLIYCTIYAKLHPED